MLSKTISAAMAVALALACTDDSQPAGPDQAAAGGHSMNHMSSSVVTPASATPFTVRAPLDPFKITQEPNFRMQSDARTDIVIQQSLFAPGAGVWHTHPGPSFIYVVDGQIQLEKVTPDGCRLTPVYGPGQAYYEVGNQVHRAIVHSSTDAVLLVTRFNIPVGQAFTIPAADPGC